MEIKINLKDGKVEDPTKIRSLFSNLDDGKYLLQLYRLEKEKTERDFQRSLFWKVTLVHKHTGQDKNDIYEEFKKDKEIESTRNIDLDSWSEVLANFQWWAFEKFDCIT